MTGTQKHKVSISPNSLLLIIRLHLLTQSEHLHYDMA